MGWVSASAGNFSCFCSFFMWFVVLISEQLLVALFFVVFTCTSHHVKCVSTQLQIKTIISHFLSDVVFVSESFSRIISPISFNKFANPYELISPFLHCIFHFVTTFIYCLREAILI